ncbi:MAG: Flp family type IVb pilin [Clostridia bacterium]
MMMKMYNFWCDIKERIKDKKGQGMVEYALIIGLVAVLLIGGLNALQIDISSVFSGITNALP